MSTIIEAARSGKLLTARGVIFVQAVVTLACSDVSSDERVGESSFPVQLDRIANYYDVAIALADARGAAALATGAIFVPFRDSQGNPIIADDGITSIRGSCGVTFISPKYAITAAHCIEQVDVDPVLDTVHLRMFRLGKNLIPTKNNPGWMSAAALSGAWPNLTHPMLTTGYDFDDYQCTVVSRCGTAYGLYNCNRAKADVALLRCPPASGQKAPGIKHGFVDAADSDIGGAGVFMPWKHEVYDIPPVPPNDPGSSGNCRT